jgi:hypothetical protein
MRRRNGGPVKYLLALIICGLPGMVVFALLCRFDFWIALVAGSGVVGFGLDVCFRGSDRDVG